MRVAPISAMLIAAAMVAACVARDYQVDSCGSLRCVVAAPSGWVGPTMVYDGNPLNVPACPPNAPSALEANHDLHADPATDCGCACKPSSECLWQMGDHGLSCSNAPTVTNYASGSCIATAARYLEAHVIKPSSCSSATKAPLLPAVRWDYTTRACSPAAGPSCNAGVCLPDVTPPFDATYCVFRDGDVACPGSPYSEKRLTYRKADDQRSCQCNCGTPSACSATMDWCSDSACTNFNGGACAAQSVDQTCTNTFGGNSYWHIKFAPEQCVGAGFSATGAAAETNPVTICCEK